MSRKKSEGLSKSLGGRNLLVENTVRRAIARIDDFIAGEKLVLPASQHRRACDDLLAITTLGGKKGRKRGSLRAAALFFTFYRLEDPSWDLDSLPPGLRGAHGDKLLSESLTRRNITLHDSITAFADNLAWKGNVSDKNVHLLSDTRFNGFLKATSGAGPAERKRIADYMAQQFAASKIENEPLPPVGEDVLTFARAKSLFHRLIDLRSEGHIQQFLFAALLSIYRRRNGIEVKTHHPHAADKFDDMAGDIEEWRGNELIRAYEVTVRDDWKNRMSNFKQKMDRFGLEKYLIIAKGVNEDLQWSVPASLALKLGPYGRDIAVIDIFDVLNFLAAEMVPDELRLAINRGYDYLSDQKLSGREDFKSVYREAVRDWLDTMDETPGGRENGTEAEREVGQRPVRGADGGQLQAHEGDQGEGEQEHGG